MPVPTPPIDFGAHYKEGVHQNSRTKIAASVFIADVTPLTELANRAVGAELRAAGYQIGAFVRLADSSELVGGCLWWPDRCRLSPDDLANLAARVADLPRLVEEARARRAAEVAASDAAYAQRGREGLPRLAAIVETAPWKLGRLIGEASEILKNAMTDSGRVRQ